MKKESGLLLHAEGHKDASHHQELVDSGSRADSPHPDWAGSHLAAMTSNFKLPEYPQQSHISLPFRPPDYGHLCPRSKHDISNNNNKLFNFES